MAKRQLQVELVRTTVRYVPGHGEIHSKVSLVTWIDAENAVSGKGVDYDGQRWVIEKAYTTAQQ